MLALGAFLAWYNKHNMDTTPPARGLILLGSAPPNYDWIEGMKLQVVRHGLVRTTAATGLWVAFIALAQELRSQSW